MKFKANEFGNKSFVLRIFKKKKNEKFVLGSFDFCYIYIILSPWVLYCSILTAFNAELLLVKHQLLLCFKSTHTRKKLFRIKNVICRVRTLIRCWSKMYKIFCTLLIYIMKRFSFYMHHKNLDILMSIASRR